MTLDIAIDADAEWDSSNDWATLARSAATAAIAESAFPQLGDGERMVDVALTTRATLAVVRLGRHLVGAIDRRDRRLGMPTAVGSQQRGEFDRGQRTLVPSPWKNSVDRSHQQ